MDGMGAPYRNVGHVASELGTKAAIALAERHGENASAIGRAMLPVRAGGRRFSATAVGPTATSEEMRWQTLSSGRFPARTGEAVVDLWVAQAREIAVGDRVRIGEGATATDVRGVGLVESPSVVAQASVYVTWPQLLQWCDHLHPGSVAVRAEAGQFSEGAKVQSPEGYVTEKRTELNNNVNTSSVMLLLFAGIALTRCCARSGSPAGSCGGCLAAEAVLLSVVATHLGYSVGILGNDVETS